MHYRTPLATGQSSAAGDHGSHDDRISQPDRTLADRVHDSHFQRPLDDSPLDDRPLDDHSRDDHSLANSSFDDRLPPEIDDASSGTCSCALSPEAGAPDMNGGECADPATEHFAALPVSGPGMPVAEVRPVRNSLAEEFSCPKCSSPSVVYPPTRKDDAFVTCRGCGAVIGTLAQFRRFVSRRLMSRKTPLSGC